MQNLLFHIDSRRIHGQIIAGWGFSVRIRRFVLADDEIAGDEFERRQYEATPGDEYETLVLSVGDAVRVLKATAGEKKTMLIVSSPRDALRVLERDLAHDAITIGNLDPGAGKQRLNDSVSIDEEQREDLLRIIKRGIRVTIQTLPQDKPILIEERLEKKE
jgi:mannose/fructose/N-acetylgalactosamine-specific phosphotransferase system component IIB